MISILSTISGQFAKSLILGAFFPAVVFVILALILAVPLFPSDGALLKPLETIDTQWRLITIFFTIIVLSGLLYNLNIPIIRFYEGYLWQNSWIGRRRTGHYQAQFRAVHARRQGMRTLLRAIRNDNRYEESYKKVLDEWNRIGRAVNNEFPIDEGSVLPTRLGNVIRSFEDYPRRQYGISAITLWPRFVAKIDKDYAKAIDDTKVSLDFTLNSSVLSAALALAILLFGLLYPTRLSLPHFCVPWMAEIIVFAGLGYWFYLLSIGRAGAWGVMVKGVFDLYRWALLEQLGHKRVPTTMAEERALWKDISLQLIYGDKPPAGPRVGYVLTSPPSTFARSEDSQDISLEITRGIRPPNVVVTDTLPDDFDYEWDSARINGECVQVTGLNPYQFLVGDMESGAEVILAYRAVPRQPTQNPIYGRRSGCWSRIIHRGKV
jgi:hypothetical protein